MCRHFSELVEDNQLCKVFWTDQGKLRHERIAQKVFFAVADIYCRATGLDLSPECDSGRGPVDFKISAGYERRVLVEVKWSTNPKLLHGFEKQVKTYAKAEKSVQAFYLVIQVADSETAINNVKKVEGDLMRNKEWSPEVIVADGRTKQSASKSE